MCLLPLGRKMPGSSQVRRGLTLIELVVVMAVLITLSALIVPRLDYMRAQAGHATAASSLGELAKSIQTFKATSATGKYPTLDLLIDESGAAYSKVYSGGGLPITATTLPGPSSGGFWYQSLLRGGLASGITQSSTAANASNSGSGAVVDLVSQAAAGSLKVAELQSTGYYAPQIFKTIFPATVDSSGNQVPAGTVPTNVKLIALGIGPNNSLVGNVMASTPLETDTDDPAVVYCRYIAIFAIYNNGSNPTPAQLKMVVDHRFKQVDKQIEQFKSSGGGF